MRKYLSLLAAPALLFAPAHAAYAQDGFEDMVSQIPEEDMSALIRFALPTIFVQVQDKCEGRIGADSYIYSNGDELLGRFQNAAEGTTPAAISALMVFAGNDDPAMGKLIMQMPPEVAGPFISEIIAAEVGPEITPDSCSPINRALELLDPMPTENLTDLVSFFIAFMAEEEAKSAAKSDG